MRRFAISITVHEGMRELAAFIGSGIIGDTEDQRYYNIPHAR